MDRRDIESQHVASSRELEDAHENVKTTSNISMCRLNDAE